MYLPDYGNMNFLYEERLRDAERHYAHEKLVKAALARRKALGEASLLTQIAQRLHVKDQPQTTSSDDRLAHAV